MTSWLWNPFWHMYRIFKKLFFYRDFIIGIEELFNCKVLLSQLVAEFAGTFIIMCPLWLVLHPESNYFLHTAFSFGLMVGAVVEAIGYTSGAHINPAVTFGTFIAGEIRLFKAVLYIMAQLFGSVCATIFVLNEFDATFDFWYINCQRRWISYSKSFCYTYRVSRSEGCFIRKTRHSSRISWIRHFILWYTYWLSERSWYISTRYFVTTYILQTKRTKCYTYSLWRSFTLIRWNIHEYKHHRIIPWPYLASEQAIIMVEGLMSFTWVLVSLSVNELRRKGGGGSMSGIVVGFTVTACHLVSQPLTGAGLNPARTYGPMYYFDDFTNAWMYWYGPFWGAIFAAVVYRLFLRVQ